MMARMSSHWILFLVGTWTTRPTGKSWADGDGMRSVLLVIHLFGCKCWFPSMRSSLSTTWCIFDGQRIQQWGWGSDCTGEIAEVGVWTPWEDHGRVFLRSGCWITWLERVVARIFGWPAHRVKIGHSAVSCGYYVGGEQWDGQAGHSSGIVLPGATGLACVPATWPALWVSHEASRRRHRHRQFLEGWRSTVHGDRDGVTQLLILILSILRILRLFLQFFNS